MALKLVLIVTNFFVLIESYHEQYRAPQVCTDKWESYVFNDREYILQNMPVRWEDAEILCRGHHNGSLAVLDTVDKADFMAEVLAETQFEVESIWIGGRRATSDPSSGYRWLGGGPLRRTAADILDADQDKDEEKRFPLWLNRTRVPVPESGADCVALDRVRHDQPVLLDLPCGLERSFACEREATYHDAVTEATVVRCKTGLYHVYKGLKNWDQAAAFCVMRRMTLANIATMKCLRKLGMTMLKSRPSVENAWIGARGEAGEWSWLDSGLSIFTPSPYLDVKPQYWPPLRDRSSIKQSGCLQLDRHRSRAPVFLEARCERRMHFICYESNGLAFPSLRASVVPPSDENYYYVLVRQLLFWQNAFENCVRMNGTLAFVDNNDVLIQLLLVMGENKNEPINHIWISGKLNSTRDPVTGQLSWYNPVNGRRIPDAKTAVDALTYMPPWLDEEFTMDSACLNLDRQDHLSGLVYGLNCDTAQYSVCMIEKAKLYQTHTTSYNTHTMPYTKEALITKELTAKLRSDMIETSSVNK